MVHRSPSMLGLDCHHTEAARGLVNAQREGLRNVDNSHFLCFIHWGIGSMNTLITPVCQMTGPVSQNAQLWCCETVQVALQICKKIWHGEEIWEKSENPGAGFVTLWFGLKCVDPRGIMKCLLKAITVLLNITAANILSEFDQNIYQNIRM